MQDSPKRDKNVSNSVPLSKIDCFNTNSKKIII